MLAVAPKRKTYPVLLPERSRPLPVSRRRPAPFGAGRRARRSPVVKALVVAAVLVIPAIAYISQRTEAARSGYAILRLRQEIAALQADNARLLVTATALKSPERIERIATKQLGMVPPRQQQLAAFTLPPQAMASPRAPAPSVWARLKAWLVRSEAEAHETH